jgi:hypothetical protein
MSELMAALFAVIIGASVMMGVVTQQKAANDASRTLATAQQQKKIYAAAEPYIQQNANTIQAMATATTPVVITVPMLQAAGMNLAGVSSTNPYGQTWQVEVLQPSPGSLQALVMSTGGDSLPDKTAALIGKYAGSSGGFIPRNDSGAYPAGAGAAYGVYAGWQVPTANYTGVSGGHPAALLTVVNGQVTNNYLYRSAIPGQPQLNQMNTALGMTGNDINSVGTLNSQMVNSTTAQISRDGQAPCCNLNGATLSLSESTNTTGRKPTIQFHSSGYQEGYVELSGNGEPRRLNLRDNQGMGLGLDATGTITAPSVSVPNGLNLHVGSTGIYGDSTDTVLVNNGGYYLRHNDNTPAPLSQVKDIVSTDGVITTAKNWWNLITRDGSNTDNSSAKNSAGSINVNDIYIRSIGKWASELGGGDIASMGDNGYTTLPSGLILQWGHYTPYLYGTGATADAFFPRAFPHAAFNCSVTPGYTNPTNDNGPLTLTACNFNALSVYNTSDAGPVQGFYWFAIGY